MVDHVRELAYATVIAVIASIGAILLILGAILQWTLEVSVEIASSFAVAASIVILIMDKVFQRPHFSMLRDKRITSLRNADNKHLLLLAQNDGTMDANLVKAKSIVAPGLFKKEMNFNPSLILCRVLSRNEGGTSAIPVRVGEEFEIFIPISLLKTNGDNATKGWILLFISTAFVKQYFLFSYKLQDNKLTVKKINAIISFFIETPIIRKHLKQRKDDSVLEI